MVTTEPRTRSLPKVLSAPTCAVEPPSPAAGGIKSVPLAVASILAVALVGYVFAQFGAKSGTLLLLGVGLGAALFHSRFGFTSAWRQLVAVGNGAGVRSHGLLLATAATVVAVISVAGWNPFDSPQGVTPSPIGWALLVGSVLFGLGMQLGGACASGTLFAVGGGQGAIVFTLGGFIIGSTVYTWQYSAFADWPAADGVVLNDHVGWGGSWALTVLGVLALVGISLVVQRRRNPPPRDAVETAHGLARVWRGSWPMAVGAVVLGVLAGGVFLVSGGIWGVTSAFSLWGARFLQLLGFHPENWAYWQLPQNAKQIAGSVWTDKTTLTDVGIMLGAAVAASLAGAWVLRSRIPLLTIVAAVGGGILMGIGARLANGCNIGAYLGGISTGNLSGWLWGFGALAGTWLGLRLRPLFGLGVPKPSDGVC